MSTPVVKHAPDYSDRGPAIIVTAVILIVLSTVAAGIRFWSRAVVSNLVFWWDDLMFICTLLTSHAYLGVIIWSVALGVGKHMWMIPTENLKPTVIMQHTQISFYITTTLFMRLSALALYARVFRVSDRMRKALWGLGGILVAFWAAEMIIPFTNCTPIAKTIDPFIPGTCASRTNWYIASQVIRTAFDFAILLLPVPMVWKLNLKLKRKILVTLGLFLGYA